MATAIPETHANGLEWEYHRKGMLVREARYPEATISAFLSLYLLAVLRQPGIHAHHPEREVLSFVPSLLKTTVDNVIHRARNNRSPTSL